MLQIFTNCPRGDCFASNILANLFALGVSVIIVKIYLDSKSPDLTKVKADDGHHYYVRNIKDKDEAANRLSKIRHNMIKLTDHCTKKYLNDEENGPKIKRLIEKYNPDEIMEVEADSSHTSYSVNKGEKLIFCLRSRDKKDNLHKLNTMMFVALHEMAHIITISIGHTDEFWNNFRFLLKEAIECGVYNYQDYSQSPENYCGIKITRTPYTK